MSQGIPKSVRDALADKRSAEQHPSPDLLNGYVEQSLSTAEKAGVTQHLAVCEDCREVVFLAGAAASEPSDPAIIEPARVWRGWKWLVPTVVALALVSGVLVERRNLVAPHQIAMQAANRQADALPSQTGGSQAATQSHTNALMFSPAPQATPNQQEHLRANLTSSNKTSPHDQVAAVAGAKAKTPSEKREALADLPIAAPSPPPSSPTVVARNAAVASAAPLVQADNGDLSANSAAKAASPSPGPVTANQPSGGNDLTYIAPSPSLKPGFASAGQATGASSVNSVAQRILHARWRITADGHLDRSLAGSAWTRVLAEQPVSFRVVAVTGNDVWAGGNNGALFHSVDGGEHWAQVALSAEGHSETGAVVSIHFDTISQGSVHTETGSTWTTSDRGQSWNK